MRMFACAIGLLLSLPIIVESFNLAFEQRIFIDSYPCIIVCAGGFYFWPLYYLAACFIVVFVTLLLSIASASVQLEMKITTRPGSTCTGPRVLP